MSRQPLRRCSGGIEGRPTFAYIALNVGDSFCSARSTIGLISRMGWSFGTLSSGVIAVSMVTCRLASPRIVYLQLTPPLPCYSGSATEAIPQNDFFSSLLGLAPAEETDIVAHSMGGLVARYFLENYFILEPV